MNLKRNRMISTIGLSAVLGLLATAAVADGDGLEKIMQARAGDQRPVPAVSAPAPQAVSAEVRQSWIPGPEQLNVPGNPAFGRVASK